MLIPELHPCEDDRLKALHGYGVLDTAPSEAFDQITELATYITGQPVAYINMIDEGRLWVKSAHGAATGEFPREITFCAHTILQDGIFEIPDAREDERFEDNPLVECVGGLRFYAGVPLKNSEGLPVGTLCTISGEASQLTKQQRHAFQALASQVVAQLELLQNLRTLDRTVGELARSNRDLARFASVASHELQEPMRKIMSFSDRLRTSAHEKLDPRELDFLDRIDRSAGRMRLLVRSVLDLARVRKEDEPHRLCSLDQILSEVLLKLKPRIDALGAKVEAEALPDIEGNALQLETLLHHLLTNALDFRRPDVVPAIQIRADLLPSSGDENSMVLSIRDNGEGVAEKHFNDVFQPFLRLAPSPEKAGIGLAICLQIVEAHEGHIRIDSRLGVGSTFYINLPHAKQPLTVSSAQGIMP